VMHYQKITASWPARDDLRSGRSLFSARNEAFATDACLQHSTSDSSRHFCRDNDPRRRKTAAEGITSHASYMLEPLSRSGVFQGPSIGEETTE